MTVSAMATPFLWRCVAHSDASLPCARRWPPAQGFRHALRASPPATTTLWSGGEHKPRAGGQGPHGALGRLETRKGLSGRGKGEGGAKAEGKREEDYSLGAFLGADLVLAFSANN